jgi:hypothetical protein
MGGILIALSGVTAVYALPKYIQIELPRVTRSNKQPSIKYYTTTLWIQVLIKLNS